MRRPSSLRVTPLSRFGAEIAGISLRSSLASEPVAAQVRQALDEHGLLIFRGQSDLRPEHHVALGSWFGSVFPLPSRFQHPRAPHADVLRVSNAEGEGFVGVGTTGWHMDGLSYATPFGVALLHIAEVPRHGPTLLLPLHPLVETLRRQQPGWERLSMRCGTGEAAVHHPLLFAHPRTPARFGVCLGKTSGLVRDRGTAQEGSRLWGGGVEHAGARSASRRPPRTRASRAPDGRPRRRYRGGSAGTAPTWLGSG